MSGPVCPRGAAITNHAAERWSQRVQPGASVAQAREAIGAMLDTGSRSTRARRWMRRSRSSGSSRRHREGIPDYGASTYVYHPDRPGVALVMQGDVVVTVVTEFDAARRRRQMDGMSGPVSPARVHRSAA